MRKDTYRWVFAWAGLWLVFGLVVDSFQGLKMALYLADPVRSLMWRLAHAHGLLLSLFFLMMSHFAGFRAAPYRNLMVIGLVLVPLGFFTGGLFPTETDPFVGVMAVPVGGLCYVVGFVGNLLGGGKIDGRPEGNTPRESG